MAPSVQVYAMVDGLPRLKFRGRSFGIERQQTTIIFHLKIYLICQPAASHAARGPTSTLLVLTRCYIPLVIRSFAFVTMSYTLSMK